MNGNRYLKPGAVVTAVLLIAASVVAWRSVAAQEGGDPKIVSKKPFLPLAA